MAPRHRAVNDTAARTLRSSSGRHQFSTRSEPTGHRRHHSDASARRMKPLPRLPMRCRCLRNLADVTTPNPRSRRPPPGRGITAADERLEATILDNRRLFGKTYALRRVGYRSNPVAPATGPDPEDFSRQARSSVAERSYHMGEVRGSIPFRAYQRTRPLAVKILNILLPATLSDRHAVALVDFETIYLSHLRFPASLGCEARLGSPPFYQGRPTARWSIPAKLAVHAPRAIHMTTRGIQDRKSRLLTRAKADVAAVYMPSGNTIDQYSNR
jgi:hypothetical protein